MNAKKVVKFNLYMSCILLVTFVLMFIMVTIAYFTDSRQASVVLTAGNVKIALSEAAVKRDASGNWVEDPAQPRLFGGEEDLTINNYGRVYPGMSIYKDPMITNTGDEPEWIAAKVTLTDGAGDLHKIMGYPGYAEIDIEQLLTGGLLDEHVDLVEWNGIPDVCINDRYAMIQIADNAEGKYEFIFLMLQPLAVGESVTIFDQVVFNQMWNSEHMKELAGLEIHVQAYGVQLFDMGDCLQAMTSAFPSHFPFTTDIK